MKIPPQWLRGSGSVEESESDADRKDTGRATKQQLDVTWHSEIFLNALIRNPGPPCIAGSKVWK
jgi:hypothetical protein